MSFIKKRRGITTRSKRNTTAEVSRLYLTINPRVSHEQTSEASFHSSLYICTSAHSQKQKSDLKEENQRKTDQKKIDVG